jgi:hypothetical protein
MDSSNALGNSTTNIAGGTTLDLNGNTLVVGTGGVTLTGTGNIAAKIRAFSRSQHSVAYNSISGNGGKHRSPRYGDSVRNGHVLWDHEVTDGTSQHGIWCQQRFADRRHCRR